MSLFIFFSGPGEYEYQEKGRIGAERGGLICSHDTRFKSKPKTALGPGAYKVYHATIALLLLIAPSFGIALLCYYYNATILGLAIPNNLLFISKFKCI